MKPAMTLAITLFKSSWVGTLTFIKLVQMSYKASFCRQVIAIRLDLSLTRGKGRNSRRDSK